MGLEEVWRGVTPFLYSDAPQISPHNICGSDEPGIMMQADHACKFEAAINRARKGA